MPVISKSRPCGCAELSDATNVRINSIGPGSVRTQMRGFTSDELTEEQQAGMVRR